MNTLAEENYLKAIYKLSCAEGNVSTNQIATELATKASSVTDMVRKLADKALVNYARYQGVSLTDTGEKIALNIVRRHRLWEYFLVEKLHFKWDEVHDMAEEMEHISSTELINRLDAFMGCPTRDPHGDPIPDCDGNIKASALKPVSAVKANTSGVISGVGDHSTPFLQYLEQQKLTIGKRVMIREIIGYDNTVILEMDNKQLHISRDVANNILIAI
ncbi:metal-dependent transcriptional regulator [Mucilaginibacter sp. 21P]|uniref:metal-dependent transcriptional regulator n=1 Tax=Mucilaginibacter sp. 21P TaxID=2778902 RepID=UPI001C56C51E|nr:metal-dependent transcriptional regulator [Mucilaginibacter sp. 21P]QXV64943.1 metal-dependent transcriptional regulator [Mucilaginibacter sp. 21P]